MSTPAHYLQNAEQISEARFSSARISTPLIILLLSTSSIVLFEPAPYDVIALGSVFVLYSLGLQVPKGLGAPLTFWSLLLVANLISMLVAAPSSGTSIPEMLSYVATTGYLIASWLLFANLTFADPERTASAIWTGYQVAAIVAIATAVAGYFALVPGGHENFTLHGRASGTFKDPNVLGPFLVPVAIYLIHRLLDTWGWAQLLRLALLGGVLFTLLITFSRGAWGNLALALLVYLFLRILIAETPQQAARLIMGAIPGILILTVAVLGLAASNPEVGKLLSQRAQLLQAYDAGRFGTQAAAIQESLSQPLGVGPNRTHEVLGLQPHNVYIKVFSDNGWLGGFSFVLLMIVTLWRGLGACLVRSPHQGQMIIVYAAVVGMLAESFIIDSLHWRHLFLLLGMLWGLTIWQRQARGQQATPELAVEPSRRRYAARPR